MSDFADFWTRIESNVAQEYVWYDYGNPDYPSIFDYDDEGNAIEDDLDFGDWEDDDDFYPEEAYPEDADKPKSEPTEPHHPTLDTKGEPPST